MTPEVAGQLALALEVAASDEVARATRAHTRCLRGIRGVSPGNVARAVDAAWRASPVELPADAPLLEKMFGTAWEDGLAAIGLAAAAIPDAADEALALAEGWLARTDDLATADAIGWMILGPARIALGEGPEGLLVPGEPLARRAAATAGLAWLPVPLEGPSAAAVRARLDRTVAWWVAEPNDATVGAIAGWFARDRDPPVQKAVRRLIRAWAGTSREAVVAWARAFPGGLPRLLADEVASVTRQRGRR